MTDHTDTRNFLQGLLRPPPYPPVPPFADDPDPLEGLTHCPTCHQSVTSYERSISRAQATALVLTELAAPDGSPVYAAPLWHEARTKEGSQLEWWGLITPDPQGRSGWWCVTERGLRFARGEISVPKWAFVVFDRQLGRGRFDHLIENDGSDKGRERITIRDVKGFDLDVLRASRRPYLRAVE